MDTAPATATATATVQDRINKRITAKWQNIAFHADVYNLWETQDKNSLHVVYDVNEVKLMSLICSLTYHETSLFSSTSPGQMTPREEKVVTACTSSLTPPFITGEIVGTHRDTRVKRRVNSLRDEDVLSTPVAMRSTPLLFEEISKKIVKPTVHELLNRTSLLHSPFTASARICSYAHIEPTPTATPAAPAVAAIQCVTPTPFRVVLISTTEKAAAAAAAAATAAALPAPTSRNKCIEFKHRNAATFQAVEVADIAESQESGHIGSQTVMNVLPRNIGQCDCAHQASGVVAESTSDALYFGMYFKNISVEEEDQITFTSFVCKRRNTLWLVVKKQGMFNLFRNTSRSICDTFHGKEFVHPFSYYTPLRNVGINIVLKNILPEVELDPFDAPKESTVKQVSADGILILRAARYAVQLLRATPNPRG